MEIIFRQMRVVGLLFHTFCLKNGLSADFPQRIVYDHDQSIDLRWLFIVLLGKDPNPSGFGYLK